MIADDSPVILTVQALTCSRRCYSDSQLDVIYFRLINNLDDQNIGDYFLVFKININRYLSYIYIL